MKKLLFVSTLLIFATTLSSCDKDDKDKKEISSSPIIGTWKYYGYTEDGSFENVIEGKYDSNEIYTFLSNGTGSNSYENKNNGEVKVERITIEWSIETNVLIILYIYDNDERYADATRFKVENDKLYLYDSDGRGDAYIYNRVR